MDDDRGRGQTERTFTDLMPGQEGQLTLFTLGYWGGLVKTRVGNEFIPEELQWKNWNDGGEGGS